MPFVLLSKTFRCHADISCHDGMKQSTTICNLQRHHWGEFRMQKSEILWKYNCRGGNAKKMWVCRKVHHILFISQTGKAVTITNASVEERYTTSSHHGCRLVVNWHGLNSQWELTYNRRWYARSVESRQLNVASKAEQAVTLWSSRHEVYKDSFTCSNSPEDTNEHKVSHYKKVSDQRPLSLKMSIHEN